MPTPTFKRVTFEQFEQVLRQFPFTRRINAVHMHHTWKPERADFRGHETIVSMWRFHTQTNGWRDIAQHITIDPQGFIWLGRNWNFAPASAAGHNGNAAFGPFMFEMIGNFDNLRDPFDGPQREVAIKVVASVQQRFDLATDTLRFHNMLSPKSCPGSALDYATIVAEVDAIKQVEAGSLAAALPPRRGRSAGRPPFPDEPALAVGSFIQALTRDVPAVVEPGDAELSHNEHDESRAGAFSLTLPGAARDAGLSEARDSGLTTGQIAAMRPHLINLTTGRFSSTGEVTTSPADVDAMFEEHLPKALQAAVAEGQPLRIVFYAHGGLVSESRGLVTAHRHIGWWRSNHVYPIYFVWETSFCNAIAELLSRARGRARGFDVFEFTTDPLLELLARAGRGPSIWGSMKASGEHACDAPTATDPIGGGAHYTARKLQAFCAAHAGRVELHAVGHSAGSVFHSHFVPLARALGAPTFKSAQFMAPAVRVDTFKDRLLRQIDTTGAVESLSIFTMRKDFERKDTCAEIYRKSLLYLIFHALEDKNETPILGLEESLRDDATLVALFGLRGAPSAKGAIVWSPTAGDTGASASRAVSHGDFDDDPPTMNSIARRVLGKADADPIEEYPASRGVSSAARPWLDEIDWPEPLRVAAPMAPSPQLPTSAPVTALQMPQLVPPQATTTPRGGRRMAVCVGIDAYPDPRHRLGGCVNDARHWSETLRGLGFETTLLLDVQASRAAIARSVDTLIGASRAGDVIVFQYAGHGTQVPDLNGDEDDGTDEALCPVDFATGALYIDDDIAEAFAKLPDGVNLTCFMDCCHSGTNSRVAVGLSGGAVPVDAKARYVRPTPELAEAHRRFRSQGGTRAPRAAGTGGRNRMCDIKFSACLDDQVALESGGSGAFTLRAMPVLRAGIEGVTNGEFLKRMIAAFGSGAAQTPMLDCADAGGARELLQPIVGAGRESGGTGSSGVGAPSGGRPLPAQLHAGGAVDPRALDTVALLARAIDTLLSR